MRLAVLLVAMSGLVLSPFARSADAGPAGASFPVYLYASPATQAFFQANEGNYDTILGQWRTYLRDTGKDFRELGRADLLAQPPRGVLVLASALLLDDQERRAVEEFGRRGGSILGSWAVGARDGKGEWRGFQFVQDLFDLRVAGEITRQSEEWFIAPSGDGPLTWPLPAGRRMYLGKIAENPLRIDARNVAARYMTWERSRDPALANGAIAFSERYDSRRVYFGFSEPAMDFHPRDDIYRMLDAILAWLRHEPRVYKAAWPGGRLAAQLIAMEVDGAAESVAALSQQLDALGLRASFFLITSQAGAFPDLLRSLARRGHELAYQADVPDGFKDQNAEIQEQRMLAMFADVRKIGGPGPLALHGFRAPNESYDQSTEILLRRHGMQYHVADAAATIDRLPYFSSAEKAVPPESALVVLPRTSLEDLEYRGDAMNEERAGMQLVREYEEALNMGALNMLLIHASSYASGSPVNAALPAFFRRLADSRDKTWVARADDIAAWWRARDRASVKVRGEGRGQVVELTVRAPGIGPGLTLMATQPETGGPPPRLEPMTPYSPAVEGRLVDNHRAAFVFNRLGAGSYSYRVLY
ncbi:polysaccharide deacetylase family protein [Noviherbaspirillum galbum]|nr:polysaccharide deacetylase family protein [Noviherbaspirillum galbum]